MTPIDSHTFIGLVERYISGDFLTEEEIDLLGRGMQDADCVRALDEKMSFDLEQELTGIDDYEEPNAAFQEEALLRFRKRLQSSIGQREANRDDPEIDPESLPIYTHKYFVWTKNKRMAAAVIGILLIIGVISLLRLEKSKGDRNLALHTEEYQRIKPIVPGSSGAILTLGNGRKIALGNAHKGLIHIGNMTIRQSRDAATFSNKAAESGQVLYNTLTTPRGRQFQVELPDGTTVWLNASSSIRFPTVFNKENRTVELSGEAYFEVAHNAGHPFRVMVKDQFIEDIGTKFNVKAYSDEPVMMTALVEGAVDVYNEGENLRLAPGQKVTVSGKEMVVSKADLGQILAWKSGFFAFQNANVGEVMRQLSRWYDVDIRYAGGMDGRQKDSQLFTGRIDRNLDLRDLLDGLQFAQMHFKIDQNKRTIIIQN